MVWLQMMGWKEKKRNHIKTPFTASCLLVYFSYNYYIDTHIYTHNSSNHCFSSTLFPYMKTKTWTKVARKLSCRNSPQLFTPHPLVGIHSHCSLPGSWREARTCWESKPMKLNESCELQLRSSGSLLRAFNSNCVCACVWLLDHYVHWTNW